MKIDTTPRRHLPLLSIAILALALSACGKKEGDGASKPAGAPAAGGAPQAMPVSVVTVSPRKVPIVIEAVGQAEGSREVEIRARVSGIIEKRLYQEGSTVPAGSVLFVIDPAPYQLAVEQARAALQQERVRKELAETDAKRLEPLVKDKAISQREYDQAVATARTATAAIASAEAKLKQAQLDLSYTKVTAPIGGISGRAQRSEGSLVTANTDTSLLTTVTQVNPIWVRFPLAESDYNRMRGEQRNARVQLVSEDGKILADNGRLNFSGTTVDQKTGAVQLRAEFPNPGTKWLPGQFVKVHLIAGEQEAILVPQGAVVQTDQAKIVMTVGPDGKAAPRPVQTANWIGNDMVITSGLKEGDQVIVDNLVKVRPGAPVAPHAPGQAPAQAQGGGQPAPQGGEAPKAAPAPAAQPKAK
ncbi:MAG TPA: efflux RND transporter periplasmic adaptor subunit [Usitatibacter sp.]|nr:efflux RND transporter periplasmic adaptor subunit [Usitatibacter sp.]